EQSLLILRRHDRLGRVRGDGDERKCDGGGQQLHDESPHGLIGSFLSSGAPAGDWGYSPRVASRRSPFETGCARPPVCRTFVQSSRSASVGRRRAARSTRPATATKATNRVASSATRNGHGPNVIR